MTSTTRRGRLETEINNLRKIYLTEMTGLIYLLSEEAGKRQPEKFDVSKTDGPLDRMEEVSTQIMELNKKLRDVMTSKSRLDSLAKVTHGRR